MKKFTYSEQVITGVTICTYTSIPPLLDFNSESIDLAEAQSVIDDCRTAFGPEYKMPKALPANGIIKINGKWSYMCREVAEDQMTFANTRWVRGGRAIGWFLQLTFYDKQDALLFKLGAGPDVTFA